MTEQEKAEERAALRLAGLMGHEFVGVTGPAGQRRVTVQAATLADCRRLTAGDATARFYRRAYIGRRASWMAVPAVEVLR